MRTTIAVLVVCSSLPACWTDRAQPTLPREATAGQPPAATDERKPERDYRAVTLAMDVGGASAMIAGLVLVHRDSNDATGGVLIDSGIAVAGFGSIITHIVMGHADRAWRRYLVQGGAALFGGVTGSLVACGDHRDGLGCTLEGFVGGTAAGLALAGVVDALVLQAPTHAVVPTVSPTEGGARVGLGGTF